MSIGIGARVVSMAAAIGEVDAAELTAPVRGTRELSELRFAAMLALYETGLSSPKIGRVLGGRDHATVMYGIGRARGLAALDPDYAWLVDALRAAARQKFWQVVEPAVVARFIPLVEGLGAAEPVVVEPDEIDPGECHDRLRERAVMAAGSARLLAALSSYKAVIGSGKPA